MIFYGDHDRRMDDSKNVDTDEELEEVIEKNGIQILKDRYIKINNDLLIAGRDDITMRAIVSSGMAGWDYTIRTEKHCEYVMVHLRQQGK